MQHDISDSDLTGYLDEALPVDEMARIEEVLRRDRDLHDRLIMTHSRRDSGLHSLGEIWRRHRLTCLDRERLGSFLLGVLSEGEAAYVAFHIETIGCRYCLANLADLRDQPNEATTARRRRYFESSAGHLRRGR
jgi:hypothetical protein